MLAERGLDETQKRMFDMVRYTVNTVYTADTGIEENCVLRTSSIPSLVLILCIMRGKTMREDDEDKTCEIGV